MTASPFLFEPRREDFGCVVSIPADITRRDDLFAALAKGLKFPSHFGDNWDALDDCLTDLSGVDGDVLIVHQDVPLRRSRDERIYLDILRDARTSWEEGGERRFVVSFPESCRAEVAELLADES